MLMTLDDPFQTVLRYMGRQNKGSSALAYENPSQMVAALHDPLTQASAVSRMHRMHYGAFYSEQGRTTYSGIAERELLNKGKGFGGAVFGRPAKGFSIGLDHFKGALPFIPLQAFGEAAFAPKGHKMSGLIGGAAKGVGFAVGDFLGSWLAGPVGGLALGLVGDHLGGYVEQGVQMLHDFNRNVKHINMGGNYKDTEVAYTMRQRAAQEMGSSIMNARQWLGKESIYMHQ